MHKANYGIGLVLFLLILAAIAAGCSSSQAPPEGREASPTGLRPLNGVVQSSGQGAVTIEVEWKGERDGSLIFNVVMDTHSVNLDQYDLGKLAVLRDEAGKEYRPSLWRSAPGDHHRTGTLTFPLPASLSQGTASYLELVIRDVAQVKERILKWELGQ